MIHPFFATDWILDDLLFFIKRGGEPPDFMMKTPEGRVGWAWMTDDGILPMFYRGKESHLHYKLEPLIFAKPRKPKPPPPQVVPEAPKKPVRLADLPSTRHTMEDKALWKHPTKK